MKYILDEPIFYSANLKEESDFSFYNIVISFPKSIKLLDFHNNDTTANKLGKDPRNIPSENKT